MDKIGEAIRPGERPVTQAPALRVRLHRDEDERVQALYQRAYGRLCGIVTSVGRLSRPATSPRFFVEGGELTGVHYWSAGPAPKPGAFHIGGYGIWPFESRIRVLGETLERYAGHAAAQETRFAPLRSCYDELAAGDISVLPDDKFAFFTPDQLAREGFLFQPFTRLAPIGWIKVASLVDPAACYVPAQFFLIGYTPDEDEPWMAPAVSTGTAAHTAPAQALYAALSELIQIDAAIGHWHGQRQSLMIQPDARTRALDALIARHVRPAAEPEFHYLPSPDLPGFTVACVLRPACAVTPAISVGLGSGASLCRTMYRSLLEAVGVQLLAAWSVLEEQLTEGRTETTRNRLDNMFDLDSNVAYYATPQGAQAVERRFAEHGSVKAAELPPDDTQSQQAQTRAIVEAFRETGKRLYYADLTTPDIRALGFTAVRTWSPDTLSLPLPSAPPAAHPRFGDYGGFARPDPHPYP
jgi:thiazole/oxazole-forming peptide maturase SagD family component